MFGGSALNPINALARILGAAEGRRGPHPAPRLLRRRARSRPPRSARSGTALGFDEAAFLGDIGLTVPAGERGRAALERLWARPTADINGIWGGYTGPGSKTVIAVRGRREGVVPPGARPGPRRGVRGSSSGSCSDRVPADARLEFSRFGRAPAIEVPTESPLGAAAQAACARNTAARPVLIGCGGSIPVVERCCTVLGIDTLLMGFGLDDDQVHSPNEKFERALLPQGHAHRTPACWRNSPRGERGTATNRSPTSPWQRRVGLNQRKAA